MTGQQLYDLFVIANLDQSCGVDDWEDLSSIDVYVWNRMAEQVTPIEFATGKL